MEIKREPKYIVYEKIGGRYVRIECPSEKDNFVSYMIGFIKVIAIFLGFYILCLFLF